jgi:hypothetical protein
MKKVTDGKRNCRLHFGCVSFGPFEAKSKLIVAAYVHSHPPSFHTIEIILSREFILQSAALFDGGHHH